MGTVLRTAGVMLVAIAACAPGTRSQATAPSSPAPPTVTGFAFTVADEPREEAFFAALDFMSRGTAPFDGGHADLLGLGEERISLLAFPVTATPFPEPSRSNDRWFQHVAIVVSDIDAAAARLTKIDARLVSAAPQTIPFTNPAAGGIRAQYFRDPEGHHLELIWYPEGKGDPRWQAKDRVFLGLDHSAVAVADTTRSLRFYRDLLGLRVAGASFNEGPEQEALSGVPGARVRITGLRGAAGPGVELLEYETPADGRARPDDRETDLTHWEITLATRDLARSAAQLRAAGVTVDEHGTHAALVRDPDGHTVRLVDR